MSDKERTLDLFRRVYLIRASEEKIQAHYMEDAMKTPMHMSMGEEAIVAGICRALSDEDTVLGTYRSHALYLAKTGDVEGFFAEMFGKATSPVRGKGGSMHLTKMDQGYFSSSAIVASNIPISLGVAYGHKLAGKSHVTAVFFGDGAVDEGCFWESINFACLKRLPLLFVYEDNGLAIHTSKRQRHGYEKLADIITRFNCKVMENHSTDTESMYATASEAVELMRAEPQPVFLNVEYYRYLEHVGIRHDFDAQYRPEEEFRDWRERDPVCLQEQKAVDCVGADKVESIKQELDVRIDAAYLAAEAAPFPEADVLYEDLYS